MYYLWMTWSKIDVHQRAWRWNKYVRYEMNTYWIICLGFDRYVILWCVSVTICMSIFGFDRCFCCVAKVWIIDYRYVRWYATKKSCIYVDLPLSSHIYILQKVKNMYVGVKYENHIHVWKCFIRVTYIGSGFAVWVIYKIWSVCYVYKCFSMMSLSW